MAITDLNGATILVTGGTGSFGRKFIEIVLRSYQPRRLIVFSRDELKQHEMRQQFPDGDDSPMRYFLGDIRDRDRLYRAFVGVDIVVHAAALKQVPACEYNPFEAIQTNIIGAKNIVDAAIDQGVKRVVAISTDKAVSPVNLYGATKLCAEKLIVRANAYSGASGTLFACVRYGNVVGSRGSVVPLFRQQRASGTVTITDPRMTRFWITLEQGVNLVLYAIAHMQGGEVFVPKIPSMNIMDLARAIAPGCAIQEIGIRPGEKLHEMLISEDEARHTTELDDVYVIYPENPSWPLKAPEHGRRLPDGFSYTSNTNERWLSVAELRRMVGEDEQ